MIYGCCVCKAIQYGYVKDQDNVVFDVHLSEGENDLGEVFEKKILKSNKHVLNVVNRCNKN